MFVKKLFKNYIFFVVATFILALSIRLYGLNWDQEQHLHPDERFLTMVVTTIQLPISFNQYFDTSTSPLNPYNYKDYKFFVYGTFPIFLTKLTGDLINLNNYSTIHYVGRVLSAIFDSLNIFGLYFLSKLILKKSKKIYTLLPGFIYSLMVLPVQLSHFFTVDTFLTFFIFSSFVLFSYWLVHNKPIFLFFASMSFGFALSCKISAILFVPIIFLFFLYKLIKQNKKILTDIFLCGIISFVIFRIFQPYAFNGILSINPDFISSLTYLKSILMNKDVFYPSEIQWLNRTPILFPLKNIILWGVGLPVSFIFLFSIKKLFSNKIKYQKILNQPQNIIIILAVVWTILILIQQGSQFTATMRYFLPIYPFICFLVGLLATFFTRKLLSLLIILHFSYAILFLSIYSRPHSRIQATDWLNQHTSSLSKVTGEYWDDPLPLYGQAGLLPQITMLHLYDPDSSQKWQVINNVLNQTDYVILSSNRLWGSITRVPDRYPLAAKFYNDLFDERLKFKKVLEINSYPGINIPFLKKCVYIGPTNFPYLDQKNSWFSIDSSCNYPGIYLRDDTAEEAFTVYDHPKVVIFQKP